jgi:hypothetical protein
MIRIAIRKGKGTGSYLDEAISGSGSQALEFVLRVKFA